jgi:hypothetical protein
MILCVDSLGVDFAGASTSLADGVMLGSERDTFWVRSTAVWVLLGGLLCAA